MYRRLLWLADVVASVHKDSDPACASQVFNMSVTLCLQRIFVSRLRYKMVKSRGLTIFELHAIRRF